MSIKNINIAIITALSFLLLCPTFSIKNESEMEDFVEKEFVVHYFDVGISPKSLKSEPDDTNSSFDKVRIINRWTATTLKRVPQRLYLFHCNLKLLE